MVHAHVPGTAASSWPPSYLSFPQELCRRWSPKVYHGAPRKVKAHTALSDIQESLQELKYYQKALFKKH